VSNTADSLNESNTSNAEPMANHELEPLEVSGVTAVTLGTAIWSVATLVMVLIRDKLEASGRGNWIAIGVAGIILGLLGMRYTKRRVARIERSN
jgi:hypothetical protein